MPIKKPLKMYVLVRKDLDVTYRCVQGGHALVAYSKKGDPFLYNEWDNHTLVYLGVPNERALLYWYNKIISKGINLAAFTEPDLHDQLTAIACVNTGEIFKDLPIAK